MVDALKNFMSTMTDAITRQVSKQVKKAMKAANSTRPLPHFDYIPTNGCEPSHRQEQAPSPRYTERERGRPYAKQRGRCVAARPGGWLTQGSGHTTTECQELKKSLHELAEKGQIDQFLKRGHEPAQPQPRDEECSTEVVAIIAGSYAEGMTRPAWKAQLRSAQQVLTTEQGPHITVPTMLTQPGRDIVLSVHPILGFGGQEVNPASMIRLSVRFGGKLKAKNLEVDFLVIDVPTAYNVILGCPTLHKMKKKEQRKRGGLHIRLSTILTTLIFRSPDVSIQGVSCLISRTITLTKRTNKLHLFRVSALMPGPLALIYVVKSWPLKAPPLAGAAGLSSGPLGHLVQHSAFPNAADTGSLIPPAFGTLPRLSPLERMLLPLSPPPRVSLDKIGGWPLSARGRTADGLRSSPYGLVSSWRPRVRSPADRLLECGGADCSALASPVWVGVDATRLRTDKLIAGFFLCGTRESAYSQNNVSVYSKLGVMTKGGKQGSKTYLLGLLVRKAPPLLFLTVLDIGSHLLRSGVSGHKDHPRPRLRCIKQKGKSGQNQTKRLTNTGTTDTLRKILKDQKARRGKEEVVSEKLQPGEPIQRFPITRLTLPPLRTLHRFYCLSHKLGDAPGLIVLPYVELEVVGRLPLLSCGCKKGFLTAVINPGLLSKQYPKSRFSFGALWTVCMRLNARAEQHNLRGRQFALVQNLFNHRVKRESETIVESHAINCYTFGEWLVHGCIHLGDYKRLPCRQQVLLLEDRPLQCGSDLRVRKVTARTILRAGAPRNSGPSATISGTSPTRERSFCLSTDLPGVEGPSWDKELVDAPSEDECLDDLSEEEKEVSPELELVLVEATSAAVDELGAEHGLPCVPLANSSSGDLMQGVDLLLQGPYQAPQRDSARKHPLRNLVHNHGIEDYLHHLRDIGVLSTPCTHAQGRNSDRGRGDPQGGASNAEPRLCTVSTRRGTWVSLSFSSIDNSHASIMSHLSSCKSNVRLSSVSLLMSLSSAASLITMA
ncbi:hypothetical protein Cgig2_019178 [Carnegiea gigantea]|uniref:Uncharacterized protein n=1 Tax=Carnegiea gigantea TaxID=171969 RepID=A0A9Q1JYE1_9CARY|nr:hypothetical protein Cgig2_019178 [Carnegiea gigantea]